MKKTQTKNLTQGKSNENKFEKLPFYWFEVVDREKS